MCGATGRLRAAGRARRRWRGRSASSISTWTELRNHAEAYRELDEERVLVLVKVSGRGKTSGAELDRMHSTAAGLFHIRDGKVTKYVQHFERGRALADLGLAE
jgi:hypothetical protein